MITDADIKKLKAAFLTKDDAKAFVTKDDLKDSLNDMRRQIVDSFDGKLKAQEKNILDAMDTKFAAQTDDIVKDVAFVIAPLFDQQDEKIIKPGPKN